MDANDAAAPPAAEAADIDATAGAPLPGDVVDAEGKVEWSPARPNEDGVYLEGDWPHNQRLRAEALAKAGKDEDPDGIVDADAIKGAKGRLDRQAAADAEAEAARLKAFPPVNANMKVEDLERIAADSDPPVDLSSAANNKDRVALIEQARSGQPAAQPPADPALGGAGDQTQVEEI